MGYESPLKRKFYVYVDVLEKYYQIGGIEPFHYRTGDGATAEFASVAAAANSGFVNVSLLEPDDSPRRLAIVLWGVQDGCRYKIKIDTGTNRMGLDKDQDVGDIDNMDSPWYDPDPQYRFWLINDYYPAIEATNKTSAAVTPRVFFSGYKYDLKDVTDTATLNQLKSGEKPHSHITIGGVTRE